MSVSSCCVQGFQWEGTPTGRIGRLGSLAAYIAGDDVASPSTSSSSSTSSPSSPKSAVLMVHDLLGWEFPNARLLADHYAREAGVAVYLPDFFGGDAVPAAVARGGRSASSFDLAGFVQRHWRDVHEGAILQAARALRGAFARVGAVGFCYGGWAVCRLAAREHRLVECAVMAHPSLLVKADLDAVAAPLLVLAPEHDDVYGPDLKRHTFAALTAPSSPGVEFAYRHFPGVGHGCLVRGDADNPGERDAMLRGMSCAVEWLREFL
ncbi:dienelactone hydrolase family protein [Xylariomycetidae sp. FL0641]|nr:dienelactone hydrolase family protein [Xylariomycetidae sp. FL0641]